VPQPVGDRELRENYKILDFIVFLIKAKGSSYENLLKKSEDYITKSSIQIIKTKVKVPCLNVHSVS